MATKTTAAEGRAPPRARNREQTAADLQAAISRLQGRGSAPTISSVAREAGVSPALIHNRYPEVAEALRSLLNTDEKSVQQRSALESERHKSRNLRSEVEELRRQVRALASVNESLRRELLMQSAVANGEIVPILGTRRGK